MGRPHKTSPLGFALCRAQTRSSPGAGVGVMATHQTHEFLRHGLGSSAVPAVLLGHGATNSRLLWPVDLQLAKTAGPG
jgi:hypothetical protein